MNGEIVRPEKDWNVTQVGNGDLLLTLKDKFITMTGANVVTNLTILKGHKLKKLELKHTDSAKAESVVSLLITFQRILEKLDSLPHDLFEETACEKSDKRVVFNSGYEYPSQTYRLTLNTTITHRIYPELYIALFPEAKEGIPIVNLSPETIEALCVCMGKKNGNNQYPLCGEKGC